MQPIYVVISANDYLNTSNRVFGSVKSAESFISVVLNDLQIPAENMRIRYNIDATASNFINDITWLSDKLKNEIGALGITLFGGHGDTTGNLDYYCMDGGIVTEDQMAAIFTGIHQDSLLLVLSDCCSAAEEFQDLNYPFVGKWVSIGATLQPEDDLQDSDGGALVEAIVSNWYCLKEKTVKEIYDTLEDYTVNSWRGNLQHFSFYYSDSSTLTIKPFSK